MSAFGQAGFGSRNRRNQLRSQGQMDPYGQQVRAAKQAPTFNVYQTQGTQQAAGQQQAQSQSQPAQQPAAAQPSLQLGAPAMPAYQQAQPIQPQSTGTPYQKPSAQAGASASPSPDYRHLRGMLPQNVDPARWDEYAKGGAFTPEALDWIQQTRMIEAEHLRLNALRGHPGDQGEALWRQQQEVAETVKRQQDQLASQQSQGAYNRAVAANPWLAGLAPGAAQPIQPQSQGTPYGADPGYADRVAAAAQQWNSTPPGSQKIDREGNAVRRGLAQGYSLDMITRGLGNTGRFAADPEGAAKFANQVEQDWIASLSSGLPQKPGPNATASEVSAYFNASEAYGRQQKAQQARDERIAAEAAFNDPARTAAGPSQRYIDTVRRQQMNQGGSALMNPFAYRSQLQAGAIDVFGNQVTGSTQATSGSSSGTPGQAQPIQPQTQGTPYPSAAPQSPATQVQQTQVAAPVASQTMGNTPGQAQPIQPQSQGTPYAQELVSAPVGGGTGLFTPEQARVQREAEQQRLETQAWLDSQNNLLAQIEADALARPGRDAQMRAAQQEAARNQTQRDQQDLSAAGVRELLNEANRAKANIADLQASISSGRIGRDEFDRLMIENNKTLARANANAQVRRLLG